MGNRMFNLIYDNYRAIVWFLNGGIHVMMELFLLKY